MARNPVKLDDGRTIDGNDVSQVMEVWSWRNKDNGMWGRYMTQVLRDDETNQPAGDITTEVDEITEKEYFKQKLEGLI